MNAKKILAVVVALALCMSACAVVASAQATTIAQATTDLPGTEDMPNYIPFIDFTDWSAEQLAAFNKSGDWGSAVASVDEGGLLTITSSNNHWAEYYTPGGDLVVKDDETGDVTGTVTGANVYMKEGGFAIPADSTTNGIAFYVDLSGYSYDAPDAETVKIYFNDADYNADGTEAKKAGKRTASNWLASATVPAGYVGWVKIPCADFTLVWDSEDVNGYVDLADCNWFMLHPNIPNGDQVFKIGKIGFYGPCVGPATFVKGEATDVPENATIIVDPSKVNTDDDYNGGFVQDDETGVCGIKDGLIDVFQPATSGGWWFQKGLSFWALDDETGDRVSALEGFTTKLDKTYDTTSDKAGICYFIDASQLETGNFWFDLYLQEYEVTDGATVKKGGKDCVTCVHGGNDNHTYIPAGFKGWVMIPFSALSDAKWGDAKTDIDNEDHLLDAEYLSALTLVASIYKSDGGEAGATDGWGFKVGKIGIWGEGTAKEQPKEDDKPEDKPGEQEKNPDSGVNAATGIASGLAIAALAVAAAAALRKKND